MLGGNHNGVDADRFFVDVLHADLRFAIGTEEIRDARAPRISETLGELVRQEDRHRHEFGALVRRISEHQPLVAGASRVDAHCNIRRLRIHRAHDRACFGIEAERGVGVTDLLDRFPHNGCVVDDTL